MKSGVSVSGSTVAISKTIPSQQLPSSTQLYDPKLGEVAGLNSQFLGQSLVVTDQIRLNPSNPRSPANASIQVCPVPIPSSFWTIFNVLEGRN